MNGYPLKLLTKMLSIYSPSGSEKPIGDLLEAEMRTLGFNARRDNVGNVIGELGSGKPTVLLCGHMDTVPGELPVKAEGGHIFGRGAVDAKASLAAMIVATSQSKANLPCKIVVAAVVDEEGKGAGIKQLISDGVKADYVVFGEPSGLYAVTIGYKGSLHLRLSFSTQTSHSASPWLAQSAVDVAFNFWQGIKEKVLKEEGNSKFNSVTGCLTKISGGSDDNFVPSKCVIKLDIRIPPKLTTKQVLRSIQQVLDATRSMGKDIKAELEVEDSLEPFEGPNDSNLVKAFRYAIRQTAKKPLTILRKTGSSDMNELGNTYHVPVIAFGPGDSSLDHTPNENVSTEEYLDAIKVYEAAIPRLVALHARKG